MTNAEKPTSYEQMTELAQAAIAHALQRHRQLGESIAVWQDGKVVVLTADQIPTVQEPTKQMKQD